MSASSHLLERAISFQKKGRILEARKILAAIIYNDRRNENAWLWYIYTAETDQEKIVVLENFLQIFPEHSAGKKALATLRDKTLQPKIIKPDVSLSRR